MKKKIVFVITKANWGGAQRYVYDMALAARNGGYAVSVLCGSEGTTLIERLRASDIETIRIPLLKNTASVRTLRDIAAALSTTFTEMHPDVVHLNSSIAGIAGAIGARRAKVPRILFTAHGWAFNEDRGLLARAAIKFLHWYTVLLCHRTIAVSESIRRQMAGLPGMHKRITTIYLGIAEEQTLDRAAARRFFEARTHQQFSDTFLVGTVAELHPIKDYPSALAAFAALHTVHPRSAYLIIGEGSLRSELEQCAHELGIGHAVHFIGFVEHAAQYLRALDVFLLASRSEAFGYAVAEAGHARTPVVATAVGGIPEIIPDTQYGILVPRGDVCAMTAALAALAGDPVRRNTLGVALETRIRERFSRARMTAATLPLYQ